MERQKGDFLSARAEELARRAENDEYSFLYSKLLSPAEQIAYFEVLCRFSDALRRRCFFFGGCLEATRRAAVFLPTYFDTDALTSLNQKSLFSREREEAFLTLTEGYSPSEVCGIVALELKGSSFVALSHRDYMGSLLGLGLERDVIGEIAVTGEHCATVFVSDSVSRFICESLTKVGKDTVKCSPFEPPRDFTPPRAFAKINAIAASERADSVVAGLTGMSRSEAKEACLSGSVDVNYLPCKGADMKLSPGDTVSIRGYGKYIIDGYTGETRSGRLRLSARKYM